MEGLTKNERADGLGVQDEKIENNHYVISIIGKDGKRYERVFPVSGFEVVNPETNEILGHLSGDEAKAILREHSAEYTADEFSWIHFVKQ